MSTSLPTLSFQSSPKPQSSKAEPHETIDTPAPSTPIRHPELSFDNGDLAVLAGGFYFLLHSSIVCRQSTGLAEATNVPEKPSLVDIEGRSVASLILDDSPDDLLCFFRVIYDGASNFRYDKSNFDGVSSVLWLATKYSAAFLRDQMIEGIAQLFPRTLAAWDKREYDCTTPDGTYHARDIIPHPIFLINLARMVDAPQLLPSAFYDLSRMSASLIAAGVSHPTTSEEHYLSDEDLFHALRGKELNSCFLSRFIQDELENSPARHTSCLFRFDQDAQRSYICQQMRDRLAYYLLRDVNGVVHGQTSDPLFAILDTVVLLTKDLSALTAADYFLRPCAACCSDYVDVVRIQREEFWQVLPKVFLDMDGWP